VIAAFRVVAAITSGLPVKGFTAVTVAPLKWEAGEVPNAPRVRLPVIKVPESAVDEIVGIGFALLGPITICVEVADNIGHVPFSPVFVKP
jgi:hypothetical protein